MRVGIAGFGKMGSAMAARLVESGCDVRVWNRDPSRVRSAGYPSAVHPRELAESCDLVISSLFDAEAIKSVYTGPDGMIAGGTDKLFVEMSTVSPESQVAIERYVRAGGAALIECPVSGTVGPARTGQLFGLAGGRVEDVDRARPILDRLCRRIEHVGPIGAGATMKLAVNLPLIAFWQAFGEAMSMTNSLGMEPNRLLGIFADTAGAPAVLKLKADAVAAALAGDNRVETTFEIDAMRKDLQLMMGSGPRRLPVAAAALSAMDEISGDGWGTRDCAWVPAFWARA